MSAKKVKQRYSKRKNARLLLIALLLILAGAGYTFHEQIYAALFAGGAVPGERVPPLNGAAPDDPGEPETPSDQGGTGAGGAPVQIPPAGELLHIDGDDLFAPVSRYTTLGDYTPDDLVRIAPEKIRPAQREWRYYLRREAYEHLTRMWEAARADGVELFIISAYRSFATQDRLFQDYASRHGEEKANTFSARAGQSEHQLGTAVDFGGTAVDKTAAFADTAAGRWLAEYAYQYGFVLSFPEGTKDITGYLFEPWHFRYIGVGPAAAWKESGLVLKQFLTRHTAPEL